MTTEEKVHEIGGRRFRGIETSTLEQDSATTSIAYEVGISNLIKKPGEGDVDFALRLHYMVLGSGKICDVLAAILIPAEKADTDWTPEIAAQNRAFFSKLTDPTHRKAAQLALVEFHHSFSVGLLLKKPSPTASQEEEPQENPAEICSQIT